MPRGIPKTGKRARRRTKAEMIAARAAASNTTKKRRRRSKKCMSKPIIEPKVETIKTEDTKPPLPERRLYVEKEYVTNGSHADKTNGSVLCSVFTLIGAQRTIKLFEKYGCHSFTEPFEDGGMWSFYYKNKDDAQ